MCRYVFCVVVMLACPNLRATLAIDTPAKSSREAWVWRSPWIEITEMPHALQCLVIIYRGIIDFIPSHKDRLILRQTFDQFRKFDHNLPVNLYLPHRRLVFCGQETALAFVVPCLTDG